MHCLCLHDYLAGHGGGLEQGGGPGPLGHDGGGGQADGDLAPRVEGGVQVVSVVVNILPNLKQQSIGINHKVTKFHVHVMPNCQAFFKLFWARKSVIFHTFASTF